MKFKISESRTKVGVGNGLGATLPTVSKLRLAFGGAQGTARPAIVTGLLAIVVAVLIAGCSTPAKVDHGPIHAKTFSFVDRGTKPLPAYTDNRQDVHALVQQAITKNLASKGITKAPRGDVTIGYLIIVGNNVSTMAVDDYFGYGEGAAELHDKAQSAYSSNKNPNYFEAGTLVIDIIDSSSFKLLRRNYATRPIIRDLPDDARAARIQEVVDEILRDLQVES